MKIGVYVGSFNPVHNGHIKIVNETLNKYLDKVIIVPTGSYWNKNNLVDIKKRITMLKFFKNEKIIIDEENNKLPYTYLILENIKKKYKHDTLYLILGADNLIDFDKWKNYKDILKYNMIIVNRHDIDIKEYLEKLNKKDNYIILNKINNLDISSTMIRKSIKDKNYNDINDKIDNRVLNYIKKNNLYN